MEELVRLGIVYAIRFFVSLRRMMDEKVCGFVGCDGSKWMF